MIDKIIKEFDEQFSWCYRDVGGACVMVEPTTNDVKTFLYKALEEQAERYDDRLRTQKKGCLTSYRAGETLEVE